MDEWSIPHDSPYQVIDPSNPISNVIYVDDIILIDPSIHTVNDLLQYECMVSSFVKALVDKKIDIQNHLKNIRDYLAWISECSKNLARRINQPIYDVEHTYITRSSYNFCKDFVHCERFYNEQKKPSCNYHHFVHSQLKLDVDSVVQYIDNHLKTGGVLDAKNLVLSIKTICFVTQHMVSEMNYICSMCDAPEMFHKHNPIKTKKQKKKAKVIPIKCTNRFSPLFQ